jgi:hypothetical protein
MIYILKNINNPDKYVYMLTEKDYNILPGWKKEHYKLLN